MLATHFASFARYNRWANRRLYAAAAALPESDYKVDRGAFFGSLHGTLNHLLVGDRIWLRRMQGCGPLHTRLNDIPYADLSALTQARVTEDARLLAFIDGLNDAALAGNFSYTNIRGEAFTQSYAAVLPHLFNHQTHHRGQAHAILTGLGHAGPELDMILFLREA